MKRAALALVVAVLSVLTLSACDSHSSSDCQRLRGYYVQNGEGSRDRCIVHDESTDTLHDAWDRPN